MDQQDRIQLAEKRHQLLQACEDLRLPVSPSDSIETLELYIKTAYDEFEDRKNNFFSENDEVLNITIGRSKIRNFFGKVFPFL